MQQKGGCHTLVLGNNGGGPTRERGDTCTARQGVTQSCLSHTLVLGSNGGGSTRERGDTCNARHGGVTQSCLIVVLMDVARKCGGA